MKETAGKTLFIVNPVSSNGRGLTEWNLIKKRLNDWTNNFDVRITKFAMEAVQITSEALRNGYKHIIVVGGDGTLNEVINGFYQDDKVINPGAFLSVVPAGTGCDFARMFNIKVNRDYIVRILSGGKEKTCDVARATFIGLNQEKSVRYFINAGDVGMGSETVARVNRNSKVLGGFWSFLLAALFTALTYKNRQIKVKIDEQEIYSGPCCLIAVANGQYFGGGMRIAPRASIDDGYLDVILVKNIGKIDLMSNLFRVYKGNHLTHPKIKMFRGQKINVFSRDQIYLELDGETAGQGDVEFEILPQRIKLLV
ncbi:MAG: diacylglycerol kinase family protein [Syntrophomonas sp.]